MLKNVEEHSSACRRKSTLKLQSTLKLYLKFLCSVLESDQNVRFEDKVRFSVESLVVLKNGTQGSSGLFCWVWESERGNKKNEQ